MTGITTYLSILTLNVNALNPPIKRHCLANWIKKEDPTICCLQETHLIDRNKHWFKEKDWKKIYQANGPLKTGRSRNTHFGQSSLQTYIDQMRLRKILHINKRGST
jgi:exonuclease III